MKYKSVITYLRMECLRGFLLIIIILFNSSINILKNVQAQNALPQANKTDSHSSQLSEEVRKFLTNRWDAVSFEQGMSLLQNRRESIGSRKLVLDKLRSKRRELDPESLQRLHNQVILIARIPQNHLKSLLRH